MVAWRGLWRGQPMESGNFTLDKILRFELSARNTAKERIKISFAKYLTRNIVLR